MVKKGRIIEQRKQVGRGKNWRWVTEEIELSSDVFFAERQDGTIDRLHGWYLTENEAVFFEAADRDKLMREMREQIDECYRKRNERWNFLCDKFGVPERKHHHKVN